MFFISRGTCTVIVRDCFDGRLEKHRLKKKLSMGMHFGEIGMIYKCRRTASV